MIDTEAEHFAGFPGVWMLQSTREFQLFWQWIAGQDQPVRRIIEIGSFCGGTLWYWSQLRNGQLHVVTVDDLVPEIYPEPRQAQIDARPQWQSWFKPPHMLTELVGDSHDQTVIDAAAKWGPYDMAFIDGDHSYDGVHADFAAYGAMVRRGGIIAMHDVCRLVPDVMRFADELHDTNMTVRFYDPRTDGTGILAVVKTWE